MRKADNENVAKRLRVAAIGECMIELNHRDASTLALAFGGDTLNTAVYVARVTRRERVAVDYVTALGDDPYSDAMVAMWQGEGVGTAEVARLPGRLPGLYLIRVDERGERRFFYYRSAAAARELFAIPASDGQLAALPGYGLAYFSAITLSILGEAARERLFAALSALRRGGGRVAFDSNYRPAGWPDRETAQQVIGRFLPQVDIALPTFDDEQRLFGDAEPAATIARYQAAGVAEVAVKLGAEGCLVGGGGSLTHYPVPHPVTPVDTTGAGDAFNAGFLAGRFAGKPLADCVAAAQSLAAAVISHRGAIIPRDAMPKLDLG
jgi:2-dehydro-3-deoxygluconokinase